MSKYILICLMLISSTAFGISTKLSDVLNQGGQAINRVVVPKADATDAPGAHSISVTGTISSPDGSMAENYTVKAFAGKLGGSQMVGSAPIDDGGAYSIAFASDSSMTVTVKVYCKTTLVATSAPAFNVTEGVCIDVTVPTQKCVAGSPMKYKLSWPTPKSGSGF